MLLYCLDSPHKGLLKAAEDAFKLFLSVLKKRGNKVGKLVLSFLEQIPNCLKKRKLCGLVYSIEYFEEQEDLNQGMKYLKYAMESVLEDNSIVRIATLVVESLLIKLRKNSKNAEEWLSTWSEDFINVLCNAQDKILILSNSIVNVVMTIDPQALELLISKVLQLLAQSFSNARIIVLLTFLVEARRLKKLTYKGDKLIVADKVIIDITPKFIDLLFGLSDSNSIILALSLCVSNPRLLNYQKKLTEE